MLFRYLLNPMAPDPPGGSGTILGGIQSDANAPSDVDSEDSPSPPEEEGPQEVEEPLPSEDEPQPEDTGGGEEPPAEGGEEEGSGEELIFGKYRSLDKAHEGYRNSRKQVGELEKEVEEQKRLRLEAELELRKAALGQGGQGGVGSDTRPAGEPTQDQRKQAIDMMARAGRVPKEDAEKVFEMITPFFRRQAQEMERRNLETQMEANFREVSRREDFEELKPTMDKLIDKYPFLEQTPEAPQLLYELARAEKTDALVKEAEERGVKKALEKKTKSDAQQITGKGTGKPRPAAKKFSPLKQKLLEQFSGEQGPKKITDGMFSGGR